MVMVSIGDRDRAPGRDRGEGRLEPRGADDRRDHQIGFAQRRFLDRFRAGGDFDLEPRQTRLQLRIAGGIGKRGKFGPELDCAFSQRRAIAAACDRDNRKPVGRGGDDLRA
jgi:hypothetical protein